MYNTASDLGNVITVSLTDANEIVNMKKELGENFEDNVDFQTSDVTIIESNDNNNDDEGNLSNINKQ